MKKIKYLFTFTILCWFANQTFAQTLHLLLFCDTDDSRVGAATQSSLKYFSNEFSNRIKEATGMYVKNYSYSGSNFSASNLDNAISSLSVSSNDAILFYFDGHGWNNGSSEYPMITFGNSGDLNNRSRSLSNVYNTLKNKGSRLTLVLANACNKEAAIRANLAGRYIAQNAPLNDNRVFFQRLFLNSKGSLIACSSQKGQASQSDATGAWFFLALRDKIDEMQYDNNITWGILISNIKSKTSTIADDNGYTQNPYYQDYTSLVGSVAQAEQGTKSQPSYHSKQIFEQVWSDNAFKTGKTKGAISLVRPRGTNGKYAIMKADGTIVSDYIYEGFCCNGGSGSSGTDEEGYQISSGIRGITSNNGMVGMVDLVTGKLLIDCAWEDIWGVCPFESGLYAVKSMGLWGFIDDKQNLVIPCSYETAICFGKEGLCAVQKQKKWGYIDKKGKEIIRLEYDGAQPFMFNLGCVKKNNKWGAIDLNGNLTISYQFDDIHIDSVSGSIFVEKNGKRFTIDGNGNCITGCP